MMAANQPVYTVKRKMDTYHLDTECPYIKKKRWRPIDLQIMKAWGKNPCGTCFG